MQRYSGGGKSHTWLTCVRKQKRTSGTLNFQSGKLSVNNRLHYEATPLLVAIGQIQQNKRPDRTRQIIEIRDEKNKQFSRLINFEITRAANFYSTSYSCFGTVVIISNAFMSLYTPFLFFIRTLGRSGYLYYTAMNYLLNSNCYNVYHQLKKKKNK